MNNREPVIRQKDKLYKRPFDLAILIAAHIFPLLWPVWVLLWVFIPVLIWVQDRGPVFFRQERIGKNGKVFTLLKFRTMVPNAESVGAAWTTEGDKRITQLGHFLRKTALDELPEILSIWKGDMSLVGPRALAVDERNTFATDIPGFVERETVRPGLTGLAQVHDSRDEARTKLKYDLQYIAKMSPWLDIKLLFISVFNTVTARWDTRTGKQQS